MLRYWLPFCLLLAPGAAVFAQDVLFLPPGEQVIGQRVIATATPLEGLVLASAADVTQGATSEIPVTVKPYKDRWLTSNKVHKYLGIGSIGAAILTGLAPKAEGGAHEQLANVAAGLGGAAILTGFTFHWDDIKLSNGFSDPDNLHMLLTTLGTLGYVKAVDEAPGSQHAGYGGAGAASMALGIKLVW